MSDPVGDLYEVLYDWEPESNDDLRLVAGATVTVIEKNEHGWWLGIIVSDVGVHKGYFPKNYVKAKKSKEPDAPKPPPRPSSTTTTSPPPVEKSGSTSPKRALARRASASGDRDRGTFCLESLAAFDELNERGYAVELEGEEKTGTQVEKGMRVNLTCCAMVWDGSSCTKKEFAKGDISFVVGSNQVTAGLDAAVEQLQTGQTASITCSPTMAYGAAGNPPLVPPNSFIIFRVTVKDISTEQEDKEASADADADGLLGTGVASRHPTNEKAGSPAGPPNATRLVLKKDEPPAKKADLDL